MSTSVRPHSVVQRCIAPPPRDATDLTRPRVTDAIAHALSRTSVLWVVASAGAGKTTAVAHAVEHSERAAWLHVEDFGLSTGRLLLYLEQSLARCVPAVATVATDALSRGIPHAETAALLGQALAAHSSHGEQIVVLDGLERIVDVPKAAGTIGSFVRHATPECKVVLVSRREVQLDLDRAQGRVHRLGERDLAFTVAEAQAALALRDQHAIDAGEAVAATGGWVTGVLFEAWRPAAHVQGSGGEMDSLSAYLAREFMASLTPRTRDFLVSTSILSSVSFHAAEALGVPGAGEALAELRLANLPLRFEPDGSMRAHPRFREFLLDRWRELDGQRRCDLNVALGHHLVREGQVDEAVERFLEAGDIAQAEDTASAVILDVARRMDIDTVERWLASFRPWRVQASSTLTAAELFVAVEREDFARGAVLADRLIELGASEELNDSRLIGAMAWCYFLVARLEDAQKLLSLAPRDSRVETMRFCIGVELLDDPTTYADRPADSGTELDGFLGKVDLAHGRFKTLAARTDIAQTALRISKASAWGNLGRVDDGLELLGEEDQGWTAVRVRAELLADADAPEEAWAQLIAGRDRLARSGSPVFRMFSLLTETRLALRSRRDVHQARAALRAVAAEPTALERIRVIEQVSLWNGLIGLIEGDDTAALAHLRDAVDVMTRWDRRLWLPHAAVYLAEAEWRAGHEDASDAAADLALRTAQQTGSSHAMCDALSDFPSVLSRRVDLERDPDGPWHDLGRTLMVVPGRSGRAGDPRAIRVDELEPPAVWFRGAPHEAKLVKAVELLSMLCALGGSATRETIVASLFESSNDRSAQSYLRMAVAEVRRLTDDPDCIHLDGSRVEWRGGRLSSTTSETQAAYKRILTMPAPERYDALRQLLEPLTDRQFLLGARSAWASEQRESWQQLLLELALSTAQAAFDAGDSVTARSGALAVLRKDAFREQAWRLVMRAESAVGNVDGVLSAYRGCRDALQELSIEPSPATKSLLQRLRV